MEFGQEHQSNIFTPAEMSHTNSEINSSVSLTTGQDENISDKGSGTLLNDVQAGQPLTQQFYSVNISVDIFHRWRRVGASEGFETDTEIAKFFVDQYEQNSGRVQPSKLCPHCQDSLVLVCHTCQQGLTLRDSTPVGGPFQGNSAATHEQGENVHSVQDLVNICPSDTIESVNSAFNSLTSGGLSLSSAGNTSCLASPSADGVNCLVTNSTPCVGNHSASDRVNCLPASLKPCSADPSASDDINHSAVKSTSCRKTRGALRSQKVKKERRGQKTKGGDRSLVNEELENNEKFESSGTDCDLDDNNLDGHSMDFLDLLDKSSVKDATVSVNLCNSSVSPTHGKSKREVMGSINPVTSTARSTQMSGGCDGGKRVNNKSPQGGTNTTESKTEKDLSCKMCQKSFTMARELRAHTLKEHEDHLYPCPVCGKSFVSKKYCDQYHMKIHQDSGQSSLTSRSTGVCSLCGKYYKKLKEHMAVVHGNERPYKCNICAASFKTSSCLRQHVESHSGERKYRCSECEKTFKTRVSLSGHLMKHRDKAEKRHVCNVCSAVFSSKQGLIIHMRIHSGERPHVCESCGKAFRSSGALSFHKKASHNQSSSKQWVCQDCGKSFALKAFLKAHLRIHSNARPFLCQICGASYKIRARLTTHLRTHSDTRDCKCQLCDKAYKTQDGLRQHIKLVHTRNVKRFSCSKCPYTSIHRIDVVTHTRAKHTGERPFTCQLCPKAFCSKKELTSHAQLHEPVKSHVCSVCGAAFHRAHRLSSHMRTHTGEKPYSCQHCGERFSWHSGLTWHMRKHV